MVKINTKVISFYDPPSSILGYDCGLLRIKRDTVLRYRRRHRRFRNQYDHQDGHDYPKSNFSHILPPLYSYNYVLVHLKYFYIFVTVYSPETFDFRPI